MRPFFTNPLLSMSSMHAWVRPMLTWGQVMRRFFTNPLLSMSSHALAACADLGPGTVWREASHSSKSREYETHFSVAFEQAADSLMNNDFPLKFMEGTIRV